MSPSVVRSISPEILSWSSYVCKALLILTDMPYIIKMEEMLKPIEVRSNRRVAHAEVIPPDASLPAICVVMYTDHITRN
jgi:hypothetical protein